MGWHQAAERRGVTIYEGTEVTAIEPGAVRTALGTVRAEVVVRALEGYTANLPQYRRALLPMYSLMIATEPLPDHVWDEIGWRDRETLNDDRRFLIYAQRTADGRIALGGRGAPYRWGSRIDPAFEHPRGVHEALRGTAWSSSSLPCTTWPSPTAGEASSASRVTGSRRFASTGPRGSPPQAGTPVTA